MPSGEPPPCHEGDEIAQGIIPESEEGYEFAEGTKQHSDCRAQSADRQTANFDPEIAGSCGFSVQPPGMKKNSMRRKEKMNYLMII